MALDRAQMILAQAEQLRAQVLADIRNERYGGTDVQMKTYNDLVYAAWALLPDDPLLRNLDLMPDEVLRGFGTVLPISRMPPSMPSERLDAHLTRLIGRLEQIVGWASETQVAAKSAREVLQREPDKETRAILQALEDLRRRQPDLPPIDNRNFDFVAIAALRAVCTADFVEAQRAFAVGAFKASAILSAGLIEGMLLDTLRRAEVMAKAQYSDAVSNLPRVGSDVNWDRVSLAQLITAVHQLGLLDMTVGRMAEGAKDFRDTVHPNAELRHGIRPGKEEAELPLALVKLLYHQLQDGSGGPA